MFSWETLSSQCSDRIPIKQQRLTGLRGVNIQVPMAPTICQWVYTHTHLLASLTYRSWFARETLHVAIFLSSELSEMESDLKGSEGTP